MYYPNTVLAKLRSVWTTDDVHGIQKDFDKEKQTSSLSDEQAQEILLSVFENQGLQQRYYLGKLAIAAARNIWRNCMQLNVIQDSDCAKVGTIDAQLGMKLANGYKISKVNAKSVVAFSNGHTDKFLDLVSIYYTEAVRWGFSCSIVDEKAENLAALMRQFRRGESAYRQYIEYSYAPNLSNRIEEAGFNFAEQVQAAREKAIAELTAQYAVSNGVNQGELLK